MLEGKTTIAPTLIGMVNDKMWNTLIDIIPISQMWLDGTTHTFENTSDLTDLTDARVPGQLHELRL